MSVEQKALDLDKPWAPAKIPMRVLYFAHGARGMARHAYRNDEFGVQMEATRQKRDLPWIEVWTSDYIVDATFPTYRELHAAVAALTERAPFVVQLIKVVAKDIRDVGRCWICNSEWKHTVHIRHGWRPADLDDIPACDAHLEQVKADPLAAIEIRRKRVEKMSKEPLPWEQAKI